MDESDAQDLRIQPWKGARRACLPGLHGLKAVAAALLGIAVLGTRDDVVTGLGKPEQASTAAEPLIGRLPRLPMITGMFARIWVVVGGPDDRPPRLDDRRMRAQPPQQTARSAGGCRFSRGG
ncbi:hypothetical protein [Streptomyces sp. NPDC058683]|uniref:hypothetical protein n=1 Tax=Streptomyces sp. NPDC058683 TaxID=3346597 RepID=UPI00365FD62B